MEFVKQLCVVKKEVLLLDLVDDIDNLLLSNVRN